MSREAYRGQFEPWKPHEWVLDISCTVLTLAVARMVDTDIRVAALARSIPPPVRQSHYVTDEQLRDMRAMASRLPSMEFVPPTSLAVIVVDGVAVTAPFAEAEELRLALMAAGLGGEDAVRRAVHREFGGGK